MVREYKAGPSQAAKAAVVKTGGRGVLALSEGDAMAVRVSATARDALEANPILEPIEADPIHRVMGERIARRSVRSMDAAGEQVPCGITMVQADQLGF
jgi:hypothetical protein